MVLQPSSSMATFAIALAVFFLSGEVSASIQDHCSDISYWDEIRYETTTKQCCNTKLKQVCTTKSDQVCQDVLELQCEVAAWGECQSTPTSTLGTKCNVKYNDFAHQNCKEVATSVKHMKKVPECKEITKNNCITDWDVDSNGNKVWAGTETCTPVTWEECDIVEKTVEFPTVKTECDVDSHIKWAEFVDITTNTFGLESKCEVKKAVNCKHVVANKCAPVVWQECKMEPRNECLAVVIHTPIQEKIHQKNCLTGDNTAYLNQTRLRNQLLQNDSFPLDLPTQLLQNDSFPSDLPTLRAGGVLLSGPLLKGQDKVVKGYACRLYQHCHYRGRSIQLRSGQSEWWLGLYFFDNAASSFSIKQGCHLNVWSSKHFKGQKGWIDEGDLYCIEKRWNDKISSVQCVC